MNYQALACLECFILFSRDGVEQPVNLRFSDPKVLVTENRFLAAPVRMRLERDPRARLAAAFMASRLHEDLRLEDVAAAVHMNKRALCNFFARAVGASVFEVVRAMRVYHAVRLLEIAAGVPVRSIAREAGYENFSSFCRAFKAVTGMPATAYTSYAMPKLCSAATPPAAKTAPSRSTMAANV